MSVQGISPSKSRVETIDRLSPPKSLKRISYLIGIIQYYSRFVQNLVKHTGFLHPLLRGRIKFELKSQH
uniref:Putative LOC100906060 [Metaseiulus occidentalis] n=1 Tax=Lepeophtheirus salmonis TaxID=72036 RepID=A0A0K2VJM4_LEPSM